MIRNRTPRRPTFPGIPLPPLIVPRKRVLAASDAQVGAQSATGVFLTPKALAIGNLSSSFRNALRRNGSFEVWQRGAGGAAIIAVAASATSYGADGWYMTTGVTQACTLSQVAGLVNGSQWAGKFQRNNAQAGVGQLIAGFPLDLDEIYPLLGQFVALSFVAKAGANWSPTSGLLSVKLATGTGAVGRLVLGYTGEVDPINTAQAITTSPVRYQFTSTIVVPTNTRQAEVAFLWTPTGAAGVDDGVTIDDVQLEVVSSTVSQASPFERLNFHEQFNLCLPHFWKTFPYATFPAQNTGIDTGELQMQSMRAGALGQSMPFWFPVRLRGTPVIFLYNPQAANAQVRDLTGALDCSGAAPTVSESGGRIAFTGNAGTAVSNLVGVHMAATASI